MPNTCLRLLLGACLAGALTVAHAAAQTAVYTRDDGGRVVVHATRIDKPVRVDGKLDDEVYGQVESISQFVQQEPKEGAPISEKTEAWVLYDDKNVYFSCRCWDTHPERIVANDMRRDSPNLRNNDNFAVELDTFHDRRNGFLFYVTPLGGLFDGLTTDERANNSDWNTVWEGKVGRFEGGWVAEIAIPFKSLRYTPGRDQVWGINIRR
jgi:Carbohydrate family 9 binding domain-like